MTPDVLDMFERVFGAMEALGHLDDAVLARCEALTTENARLWDAIKGVDVNLHRDESLWGALAELRDELHALAERFEWHQAQALLEVVRRAPRVSSGYCRSCAARSNFTEGKCDVCASLKPWESTAVRDAGDEPA